MGTAEITERKGLRSEFMQRASTILTNQIKDFMFVLQQNGSRPRKNGDDV
jgi:hypothetical protein